jgi:hypothetical protein
MIYVRPEKTEFPYFPGYVFRTSLIYGIVLPDGVSRTFQWNDGNFIIWCHFGSIVTILYFSSLSHCTSLRYYVVLLSVTILYFPLLSYLYFSSWLISVLPANWFYHFSSTSRESCTSEIEYLYFLPSLCVLPGITDRTSSIFAIVRGDLTSVLHVVNTCISCSHTSILPFR